MTGTEKKPEKGLYRVLDKGFVKLVDFMGGDQRAVQSARVTFGSRTRGAQKDKRLIEYLLAHGHHTPFEHCVFQFHIKCPIFVARQWMRHRMASYNEVSARYTEVTEEFYIPPAFRAQDRINRQGSTASPALDQSKMLAVYEDSVKASYRAYKELIKAGAAREMARMALPVSQYTQFYWSVNARSLLNFLSLRMDAHAQSEIRDYAGAISKIFNKKMPWTWEAFLKLHAN
ncbi:MAG: FAD-dependent thymidylate synthase [Elusimicrobia bacterium GWC2_51_8]|nr:MAG: FAD-dependent thymidylate synthase [Elusimicrobia bacterium GWA2_51_34]OGR64806.1 MAG: FAD-dependent thymidylate synthase [Elusimicrobia bacterium GWC2_51_8]OGR86119.1 MAG: FAD-dependent thymidylate synthase [Elusimicrobia bacterium GWF2_52_66]HAF96093.1 FAD-dependent thymidylate synthase [Elusimicrobiota bacterium]HCE97050.1 FAD-dependent thymidylate synthase [Elusimicrobiota bacterium]